MFATALAVALASAGAGPLLQAPAPAPELPAFAQPRLFATGFASGPGGEAWLVAVVDFDGDGFADVVAANRGEPGSVHVLMNVRGGKCTPLGEVAAGMGAASALEVRRLSDGREELVILGPEGAARTLARGADGVFAVRELAGEEPSAAAEQALARPVPQPPTGTPEGAALAYGDLTGDGIPDLLIVRRDAAWREGSDLLLLAGIGPDSTDSDQDGVSDEEELALGSDPHHADSDGDGLLDGWELRGEGGIDLPGLGASPNRLDCVVYVQCIGEVDVDGVKAELERVVRTWAELPTLNRDGSTGISLHVLPLPPLGAEALAKPWWQNAAEQMPRAAKGLAHYMQITPGSGGQAAQLGDAGSCGAGALWATFLHEFGHQVGLSHAGGDLPGMCPTYTSLMSYAYAYSFEEDGNKIRYSTGHLASFELNETRLVERLPLPLAELAFLGKQPFAFRLQEEGDETLVDWNRNGVFETEPVRADITDVYGADGGTRHNVAKSVVAPSLASHQGTLWVFSVDRVRMLQARAALDTEGAFSPPVELAQVAAEGDPWALSVGARLILLVPTAEGVAVLQAEDPSELGSAAVRHVPSSIGAQVSAFARDSRVHALLWNGPDQPVRISQEDDSGVWSEPAPFADLASTFAASAVVDPASGELVVGYGTAAADGSQRDWRVARFQRGADGWTRASERVVGGPEAGWYGNSRPVLLIQDQPGHPAPGRLHFVARGWTDPVDAHGCWYEAITIGDPTQHDGWRLRRWYDEWTTTRSPVAAAFHAGDLALAYRWYGNVHGDEDENLQVTFHGFGIRDQILRDFDDVTEIARLGLARSIPWRDPSEN